MNRNYRDDMSEELSTWAELPAEKIADMVLNGKYNSDWDLSMLLDQLPEEKKQKVKDIVLKQMGYIPEETKPVEPERY